MYPTSPATSLLWDEVVHVDLSIIFMIGYVIWAVLYPCSLTLIPLLCEEEVLVEL